jgi:hypothetical protein
MTRLTLKLGVLVLLTAGYAWAASSRSVPNANTIKNITKSGVVCPCDYYGSYISYICQAPEQCGGGVDDEYGNTCVCVK